VRQVSARLTATVLICALAALLPSQGGRAQGDSEEIRRRFLKAREEQVQPQKRPSTPTPAAPKSKGGKPKPKPKPKPHPLPKKPAQPAPSKASPSSPTPVEPAPGPKPPHSAGQPLKDKTVPPPPFPAVVAKPEQAPVIIEKSGFDSKPNYQPGSFFGWFSKWKYLTKSLREEIDKAPVQKARWRYIVVHNSGTRQGNAKAFDFYHTKVRKMSNGLAYHFVIGNGTSSGDGQIEVGNRWKKQINGGHVHSDYLNNIALGICLVGDFNQEKPTAKQLEALDELIRYLRQRTGKIDGKWAAVKAHKDINPPKWPTDCPGNDFPYAWLRNRFE
jgi:hypothetical protein